MKRLLPVALICTLATLTTMTSCSKDKDDPVQYTVTVASDPSAGGTATAKTGDGTASASVKAVESATITLTATPAEGYVFDKWTVQSGGATLSGTATATATFNMPKGDVSIKAGFTVKPQEPQIEMPDESEKTQTAFADEESTGSFTFTAKSDWTATVKETTAAQSAAVPRAEKPEWLRLLLDGKESYSGAAGTFNLSIEVNPNYTGKTRSATITLDCSGTYITITVTQEGKKEDGTTPVAVTDVSIILPPGLESPVEMEPGTFIDFVARVTPENATNKTLTWSVSPEDAATVDNTGRVTLSKTVKAGTVITVTATSEADPTKKATQAILAVAPPSAEELLGKMAGIWNSYVYPNWLLLDARTSSLSVRQSMTPTTTDPYYLWSGAYDCISAANQLLERVDDSDELSESDKAGYRGKAFATRGITYFYLKSLFGGVPLVSDTDSSVESLARSTAQETVNFIYDDIDRAADLGGLDFIEYGKVLQAILYLQENDGFNQAAELMKNNVGSAMDLDGDGTISVNDDLTNIAIWALLAEAQQKAGNIYEAVQSINHINLTFSRPLITPSDNVLTAIREIFSLLPDVNNQQYRDNNTRLGVKFLNAVRWGDTQGWGFRALLPIPAGAIGRNPGLEQNPGW